MCVVPDAISRCAAPTKKFIIIMVAKLFVIFMTCSKLKGASKNRNEIMGKTPSIKIYLAGDWQLITPADRIIGSNLG